ncbi:MAG TPA: Gfo/Idh/MocA family oxidoreductase [Pseudonocardiaceae bacterium]|jgi:predicted dehydrogenase|nr:Gfo/Idh/MocA family oxidoreductase [Pseudonocardiaceae bacterium]
MTRWAVLGTANIAARAFLPAMRTAGGEAVAVGSRDPGRAANWARENHVGRAVTYEEAIAACDVDAIYIAVPNDQHVHWAGVAAASGKAVVCEKPLGLDAAEVDRLLAQVGDARLWESFVFPFHPQTALLAELCAPEGPIGGVREIISEFHFRVLRQDNIRWNAGLGGGALLDVGCYPIRLARLLFGAEPIGAAAEQVTSESGVDAEFAAVTVFPGDQRLIFSVGMRRFPSTYTRVLGDDAELRVSNPFHPTENDTVQLWRGGKLERTWTADPRRAFQHAIEHVGAVVAGTEQPRHLAATDAPGNARALDLVRAAAR